MIILLMVVISFVYTESQRNSSSMGSIISDPKNYFENCAEVQLILYSDLLKVYTCYFSDSNVSFILVLWIFLPMKQIQRLE
jgi:hypothetical protein